MPEPTERPPEMLVKQSIMELLPKVDTVIFDVDGVIVDVSGTFRVVVCETVQFYAERFLSFEPSARLLHVPETELFKNAGGFNNDWELTHAVVLLYIAKSLMHETLKPQRLRQLPPTLEEYTDEIRRRGGGLGVAEELLVHQLTPEQRRELSFQWNRKQITQIFQEMYGGIEHCEQLYGFRPEYFTGQSYADKETILIDRRLLEDGIKYGLLTGRTIEETRFAVNRSGMAKRVPESHWVTHDDGVFKPDGRALWTAADRTNARLAIYIGDTLDDLRTVDNYKELRGSDRARIISCMVLSGAGGVSNHSRFLERGVEILAPDANAVLALLQNMKKNQLR